MLSLWKDRLGIGVALLIAIYFVTSWDPVVTGFSWLSQQLVGFFFTIFVDDVEITSEFIRIVDLEIGWTEDCSGTNLLLMLLGLCAWVNRNETDLKAFALRFCLVLPAAILANVLRVLTLIGYRFLYQENVESMQFHYFVGFFWVVAFAWVCLPRAQRVSIPHWISLIHASAVISFLSPLLGNTSHIPLALAVVALLGESAFTTTDCRRQRISTMLWGGAALPILWVGIDSLWLPWLLCCPVVFSWSHLKRPVVFLLVMVACPIWHLYDSTHYLSWGILAWWGWQQFGEDRSAHLPEPAEKSETAMSHSWALVCLPWFAIPFVGSQLLFPIAEEVSPPSDMVVRDVPGGYELRLPERNDALSIVWYKPNGSDRHHALETCLKYRGIELEQASLPGVRTDGRHWFREYYLVEGKLIDSHPRYLKETLGIRRSPGVHLITVALAERVPEHEFAAFTVDAISRLVERIAEEESTLLTERGER